MARKSPYELLLGKIPSLTHLKVIGCLCFATNLTGHDKFAPRAMRSVLLGNVAHQKGYKLLDLENRVFFISRDVVFYEDIFPFHTIEDSSEPLFLNMTPVPIKDFAEEPNDVASSIAGNHPEVTNVPCSPVVTHVPLNEQDIPHSVEHNNIDSPRNSFAPPHAEETRKSTRVSKPPIWLKDYVRNDRLNSASCCRYPISEVIGYEVFS